MEIPVLLQVYTRGIKNPVGICVQKQHQRPGNPTRVSLTPSLQHGAGISTHGVSTTAPGLIPKNCYLLEKPHPQAQTPRKRFLECAPKGMFRIKAKLQVPGWFPGRIPNPLDWDITAGAASASQCSSPSLVPDSIPDIPRCFQPVPSCLGMLPLD